MPLRLLVGKSGGSVHSSVRGFCHANDCCRYSPDDTLVFATGKRLVPKTGNWSITRGSWGQTECLSGLQPKARSQSRFHGASCRAGSPTSSKVIARPRRSLRGSAVGLATHKDYKAVLERAVNQWAQVMAIENLGYVDETIGTLVGGTTSITHRGPSRGVGHIRFMAYDDEGFFGSSARYRPPLSQSPVPP